jgi:hypothetical protein
MKMLLFCAVIIVPFGDLDMWGMMHCIAKSDFIKMTIKALESYLSTARQQAEKFGQEASKVICVMDMENFNIRQYAWRPGKYHQFLISTRTVHIRIVLLLWQSTHKLHRKE